MTPFLADFLHDVLYDPRYLTWAPLAIWLLPLLGFVTLLFLGKRLPRGGDFVAIALLGAALLLALGVFNVIVLHDYHSVRTQYGLPGDLGEFQEAGIGSGYHVPLFEWLQGGLGAHRFRLPFGLYIDAVSAIMMCVVTGLGLCVLVFSTWYMDDDETRGRDGSGRADRYPWYFAAMSFFLFAMLGIVISDNLLLTFICWELVGLGSYWLIGFWYHRSPARAREIMGPPEGVRYFPLGLCPASAQKKAFVMNRIGDFGFMTGILVFFFLMTSPAAQLAQRGYEDSPLSFHTLYQAAAGGLWQQAPALSLFGWEISGMALLSVAGIGVLMGAMGKSAQFPLHTWLPDAMQGPTTGSSIIHAATMVAAGVYLVGRMHPLLTADAATFLLWVGAITCFLCATIACVQWDLKGVLAYSTCSQLGYMMLGLGAFGYFSGIAHLFTHAFFKCMLFLAAGALIHTLHTQNLWKLGNLRGPLRALLVIFAIGLLAIAGIPGFTGFYSKDEILAWAYANAAVNGWKLSHALPFALGMATAGLTAFYMTRQVLLIFWGETTRDAHVRHHVEGHRHTGPATGFHRPPLAAMAPLFVLAIFCFGFVWEGVPNLPFLTERLNAQESDWLHHAVTPVRSGLAERGRSEAQWAAYDRFAGRLNAVELGVQGAPPPSTGEDGGLSARERAALSSQELLALPETLRFRAEIVHHVHATLGLVSIAVALLGMLCAWALYRSERGLTRVKALVEGPVRGMPSLSEPPRANSAIKPGERLRGPLSGLHAFLTWLWGIDFVYDRVVVALFKAWNRLCGAFDMGVIDGILVDGWNRVLRLLVAISGAFDNHVVDRAVDFWGTLTKKSGAVLRNVQDGRVQAYLAFAVIVLGVIVIAFARAAP